MVMNETLAFLGIFGVSALLVGVLIFVILAFEIYMFVHLIRNDSIDSNTKILWALGMLILHPFVAIIYYFTDYQKS